MPVRGPLPAAGASRKFLAFQRVRAAPDSRLCAPLRSSAPPPFLGSLCNFFLGAVIGGSIFQQIGAYLQAGPPKRGSSCLRSRDAACSAAPRVAGVCMKRAYRSSTGLPRQSSPAHSVPRCPSPENTAPPCHSGPSQDPGKVLLRVGTALPQASNFFMHYFLGRHHGSCVVRQPCTAPAATLDSPNLTLSLTRALAARSPGAHLRTQRDATSAS
jgi:hypothetical protein